MWAVPKCIVKLSQRKGSSDRRQANFAQHQKDILLCEGSC